MIDDQQEPTTEENTNEESTQEEAGYQFEDALTSNESSDHSRRSTGGRYASEIFSKTIHAKFRTFYIDLKESQNGKFLKISEKSRGRKSTIMMDSEDVAEMIQALQEVQENL